MGLLAQVDPLVVQTPDLGDMASKTPQKQWGRWDLNPEPTDYESAALTD